MDLKSFRKAVYKETCGGRLKPVLESIRLMKELGIWVEVTTLIIPDQNDTETELGEIAHFIAGVNQDIPWHISRFHPDYTFTDSRPTPFETLRKALALGKEAGLKHVYMGNVPRSGSDTACPHCDRILIQRAGFTLRENKLADSRCPSCGKIIAGIFE